MNELSVPAPEMRPISVQLAPPLALACTATYSPYSRPTRLYLSLSVTMAELEGVAARRWIVPRPPRIKWRPVRCGQPMAIRPSYGELLSCSSQSPYQRCVPSLLANELLSKLSRTYAAANVVTIAFVVTGLTPAVERTRA